LELVGERCDQQRCRKRDVGDHLEAAMAGERDDPFEHVPERIAPRRPAPPPRGGIEVPPRGGGGFVGAAEEPEPPSSYVPGTRPEEVLNGSTSPSTRRLAQWRALRDPAVRGPGDQRRRQLSRPDE